MSRRGCNGKRCTLEFDGASKGNPGRAGAGAVIRDEHGRVIARARQGLGRATNNAAEYEGLRLGLETALGQGFTDITVVTDSQLVANQVQGYWKIRNPKLRDLCYRVRGLANQFRSFNISHFDRGYNVDADTQANMATYLWPGEVQYENGDDYYKDNFVYVSGYAEAGEVYDKHGDDYYEDDEANYMQPQGGGYAVAGEVYDEHGDDYYDDEDISMQPQGGGCSVAGGVHHAQGGDYYGFKDNSAIAVGYSGVQDNTIQGDYSCQQGNCAKQEYDNPGRGDDYYNEVTITLGKRMITWTMTLRTIPMMGPITMMIEFLVHVFSLTYVKDALIITAKRLGFYLESKTLPTCFWTVSCN